MFIWGLMLVQRPPYDKDSNLVKFIDNNGTEILQTFDALNRLAHKQIQRAADIVGTTIQTFEYDGLSRLTKATDNNDPDDSADDSTVERYYDSLGRLLEEAQNGQPVSFAWKQAASPVSQTYTSGRALGFELDKLGRLTKIAEGVKTTAAYD